MVLYDNGTAGESLKTSDEMAPDKAKPNQLGPTLTVRDLHNFDSDSFFCRIEGKDRMVSHDCEIA